MRAHAPAPDGDHRVPSLRFRGLAGGGVDHPAGLWLEAGCGWKKDFESASRRITGTPASSSRTMPSNEVSVVSPSRPNSVPMSAGGAQVARSGVADR